MRASHLFCGKRTSERRQERKSPPALLFKAAEFLFFPSKSEISSHKIWLYVHFEIRCNSIVYILNVMSFNVISGPRKANERTVFVRELNILKYKSTGCTTYMLLEIVFDLMCTTFHIWNDVCVCVSKMQLKTLSISFISFRSLALTVFFLIRLLLCLIYLSCVVCAWYSHSWVEFRDKFLNECKKQYRTHTGGC